MSSLYSWLRASLADRWRLVGLGALMLFPLNSMIAQENYRVVTFGDSTTADRGGVRNYTTQIAEQFPALEVINKGVGGHTTSMAAGRFQSDVLDQKPDLVVIQFGINDAAVDVWKTPPATKSRVSLADYEKNLRRFVGGIRSGGGEVILMTPNQVRWSTNMLEKYGKPPYNPGDVQGFTRILGDYADVVRNLAQELNLPLVDVYSFYETPERRAEACVDLLPDGMHPSEKGHALVAAELATILELKIPRELHGLKTH